MLRLILRGSWCVPLAAILAAAGIQFAAAPVAEFALAEGGFDFTQPHLRGFDLRATQLLKAGLIAAASLGARTTPKHMPEPVKQTMITPTTTKISHGKPELIRPA